MTNKGKTPLYSFANFCLKFASKWSMGGFKCPLDSPKNEKENSNESGWKQANVRS